MPIDPNIPLAGPQGPFGPNMAQVYAAQNQNYRNFAQNQEIAGTNALQSVFANQNNLNPATGLPTPQAMAQVLATSPQMGLDFLAGMEKMNESRQRSGIANFGVIQKYNTLYDEKVAGPALEYNTQLEQQGLPPEQRLTLYNQKRKELTDNLQKAYGIPDPVIAAVSNQESPETTAFKSATFKKQQANINKGWSKPQVDDTGNTFFYNKFSGGAYLNQDLSKPYQVQGNVREAASEKEPEAFVDPTPAGPVYGITKNPATGVLMKDGAPYTPVGTLQKLGAGGAGRPPAAKEYRVLVDPADPSKGTRVELLTPPAREGEPYRNREGKAVPAPVSDVHPGDLDAPGTPEMTPAAATYIGRARVYGVPIPTTWGTAKWLPQVVDETIKGSLGLPQDAKVTVEDANAAALNDAAIHAGMHAEAGALQNLAKLNSNIGNFEGTALRNANLIEGIGPDAAAGGPKIWNRLRNASRREIENDPSLTKLDNAVTDFKNEYVRIMSTAAGTGSMTSDAARAEGDRLFNVNQSYEVMQGTLATARQTMKNRVDSVRGQYVATQDSIRDKGRFAEQAPLAPTEGQEPKQSATTSGASAPLPPGYDAGRGTKHDTVDDAKAKITPTAKPWAIDNHGTMEYWRRFPDGTLRQTDISGKPLQ